MLSAKHIWFLCIAAFVASECSGSNAETRPMSNKEAGDWGAWREVGKMEVRRRMHSAVLLKNGNVLVVGGMTFEGRSHRYENSCELYNPKTERWQMTSFLLNKYGNSTAFRLKNGKVLVIGRGEYPYDQCELYDPSTGTWSSTGSLIGSRDRIYATLLSNGQVLVAGGDCRDKPLASCERYDPRTENWSPAAPLSTPRAWHRLVSLQNGKVLAIAGAKDSKSCELYDPEADKWAATASLATDHGIFFFVIGLPNGKVLVAGGTIVTLDHDVISSTPVLQCEVYDPTNEHWEEAAPLPRTLDSNGATATVLANGSVLLLWDRSHRNDALLYNVATDEWREVSGPNTPRHAHTAVLLSNGDLMICGGRGSTMQDSYLTSSEIFSLLPL